MINKIKQKLENHQFSIKNVGGKDIVFKVSDKGYKKKVGKIYDNGSGVHFFAQNVHPFVSGKNSYAEIFGNDDTDYKPIYVKNTTVLNSYVFSNKEYANSTQIENTLRTYITKLKGNTLTNLHCVRGVKNDYNNKQRNYLNNETVYPYFNYDGSFVSAKIVAYNPDGKRLKNRANWFHSYKPIKKHLNILNEPTSKGKGVFFGEHLLKGNNKKVVIVEGEKGAAVLQELFEHLTDIVFLSSGGATSLNGLNYNCLNDRDVYLFPDKGVQEWFDIGKKRNWNCDYIIENSTDALDGDDVTDFIDKPLWLDITKSFERINEVTVIKQNNATSLNYALKPKIKNNTCLPNWYDLKFRGYEDDADVENPTMECFEGKYFKFYKNGFKSKTANIDFNKWVRPKDESYKLRPPNEDDFIKGLEKAFRVAKYINRYAETIDIKTVNQQFKYVLYHLQKDSNFSFNAEYVLNELVPEWNAKGNDITEYISEKRNWRVNVPMGGIPNDKFESYLAEDKRRYTTNKYLKLFKHYSKSQLYISLKNDIGMHQRRDNSFVWDLITEYNKEVIGCNTINQWNKSLEIQEYCIKNTKLHHNFTTLYRSSYIVLQKSKGTFKPISMNSVFTKGKFPYKAIERYFSFKPNENLYKNITAKVDYLLEFTDDLKFKRNKKRLIEVSPLHSLKRMSEILDAAREQEMQMLEMVELQKTKVELPNVLPIDAFDYDLNTNDGVFGCSEDDAQQKGREFLYHWLCHKYKLKGLDAADCWANPEAYLSA